MMDGNWLLLLPIVVPVISGLLVKFVKKLESRKARCTLVGGALIINLLLSAYIAFFADGSLVIWQLTRDIPVALFVDDMGRVFMLLVNVMWTLAAFYSFEYMRHENNERRFYTCYLITLGALSALSMARNIVTFYMFYEAMTLLTVPLVVHSMKKEAVAAGVKYLVYSVFGASLALAGVFLISPYLGSLSFVAGGTLKEGAQGSGLLIVTFMMVMGFSVKAGMFPMHGWLPTAHPAAPAPASAVLSGVITKMGVLGIIRVVFYMVGADALRGTWVQQTLLILALITVFMGSMLAMKENGFKKRLAYSTVSQVSYVLLGLFSLSTFGLVGALMHVVAHSAIKNTLFMGAGAVINKTGKTQVADLRGMGLKMPVTMALFTIVSLGLIGIPPTGGFISKWYLAQGALTLSGALAYIAPATLLLSAILTAVYLLGISVKGFFPGKEADLAQYGREEVSPLMLVPMGVLAFGALLLGMFPGALIAFFTQMAATII